MVRTAVIFALLTSGCSQPDRVAEPRDAKRVRLASDQDPRCREGVANGLAPGSFDYGVVSSAGAAKQMAEKYWRDIFVGTDVPVEEVLQRPLAAEVRQGLWHVETTLPEGAIGVGFIAEICQSNGRVVTLTGHQ